MTKIRCGIRENAKYLEGRRDLTATQDAKFIKILARDAGLFGCLSGIWEIVRCSSKCESASECSVVSPIKANYKGLHEIYRMAGKCTSSSIPLLFKLFTFIVSLMKKLFDQLNLRYDEQYNDSVPLNQTVIVLVSPLFSCIQAVTDYGSNRSKAQRKGVMIRAGKESGKKPSPPLSFFASSSPVFLPLYHILV